MARPVNNILYLVIWSLHYSISINCVCIFYKVTFVNLSEIQIKISNQFLLRGTAGSRYNFSSYNTSFENFEDNNFFSVAIARNAMRIKLRTCYEFWITYSQHIMWNKYKTKKDKFVISCVIPRDIWASCKKLSVYFSGKNKRWKLSVATAISLENSHMNMGGRGQ